MKWSDFIGHADVRERLRRSLENGRLASTYLFVGHAGIGKRTLAILLAKSLLCEATSPTTLDFCDACGECRQVDSDSHPDIHSVGRSAERNFIPVETFIGDREHRMREGLCHDISLKPFGGRRKIAIIDDADYLNEEGANSLLKTLEEPPPKSLLVLVGVNQQSQLPTIRSRCQIVHFRPLSNEQLAQLLLREGVCEDADEAGRITQFATGLDDARAFASAETLEFREAFMRRLAAGRDFSGLLKEVQEFIETAGKEAPARRRRLRLVVRFALDFFQLLMQQQAGAQFAADPALLHAAEHATAWKLDGNSLADCLQRCLQTLEHIDRNANQATLLECWLDDLQQLSRRGGTEEN